MLPDRKIIPFPQPTNAQNEKCIEEIDFGNTFQEISIPYGCTKAKIVFCNGNDNETKTISNLPEINKNDVNFINQTAYDIIKRGEKNLDKSELNAMVFLQNYTKKMKSLINFFLTSFIFVVFSLVGLVTFFSQGIYFIHPFLYIMTLIMGIGWGLTAFCLYKNIT